MQARPILVTDNQDTWRPEFTHLWTIPEWVCLDSKVLIPCGLPSSFENKTPLFVPMGGGLVELRWFAFVYPGPCGRVTHWLLAGEHIHVEQSRVLWYPHKVISERWSREDLASISYFQDSSKLETDDT